MIAHRLSALAMVGTLALAGSSSRLARAQQSTFRATADAVILDVSVRSGGRPVTELTAADFSVVDNGVRQEVEDVSIEALPIDATFIVDISGEALVHGRVGPFASDVTRIASLLGRDDRLRILADSKYVTEVRPPGVLSAGGGTSTNDAFIMALMQPPERGRRRLVIAFTEGVDYGSVTGGTDVVAVAKRSDVLLHVVTSKIFTGGAGVGRLVLSEGAGPLIAAAAVTGGEAHEFGSDVVSSIRDVLEDFRRSYLLSYVPRGVDLAGWHDVAVTVSRSGKYDVRARSGYSGG